MEHESVAASRTTPASSTDVPERSTRPAGRRVGSLATLGLLGLATGAAFAGGAHLRARFTDHLVGGHAGLPGTRLAQADRPASGGGGRPSAAYGIVPGPPHAGPARTSNSPIPAGGEAGGEEEDAAFLNAVGLFEEVYATVKDSYVDKLPDETRMAQGAVRAMVAELNDPNCRYLEPAERAAFQAQARDGRFAGIGAALRIVGTRRDGYTEHKITLVAVLPGSPAEKAGLRAGDVVSSVDNKYVLTAADPFAAVSRVAARIKSGEATEEEVEKASEAQEALVKRVGSGITLEKAIRALSVGENEKRTLVVQRANASAGAKPFLTTATLTTAVTSAPTPSSRTLAGGATYVRVTVFTSAATDAVTRALASGAPGVVLDLRDNPGGPLPLVQSIAGALLRANGKNAMANAGSLFTLVGPRGKRVALSAAGPPVPATANAAASSAVARSLVVLVNRGTAGEAEALAVALRDQGGATLMGGRTFGDGLVQTLFPLADGSGVLLTTGKLIGPRGTDWQNAGLAPAVTLAAGTPEEQVLLRAAAALHNAPPRPGVARAAAAAAVRPSR